MSQLYLLGDNDVRGAYAVGEHRYHLWRTWNASRPAGVFIMLNPSRADAMVNDPTIEACIQFASRWGWGRLDVLNLYSWRATDPRDLRLAGYPNGPEADDVILRVLSRSDLPVAGLVFAWGNNGLAQRVCEIEALVRESGCVASTCLGKNRNGSPRHPLYIRRDAPLVPWKDAN